jgi:hypothetical protein
MSPWKGKLSRWGGSRYRGGRDEDMNQFGEKKLIWPIQRRKGDEKIFHPLFFA